MNELFLMAPMGLGDSIILCGAIRELAKQYEKVFFPCYVHNDPSVKFMFSDLPSVEVEAILHATDIFNLELGHQMRGCEILRLGTYNSELERKPESFDMTFYRQAGIPFSKRWDSFFVPESKTTRLIPQDRYSLVLDDWSRGFKILASKMEDDLAKVVIGNKTETIFDLIPSISKASNVHAINSAPAILADSIPTSGNLFMHRYARPFTPYDNFKLRKPWKIIL